MYYRSKELQGAHYQVQLLQKEVAEQTKEVCYILLDCSAQFFHEISWHLRKWWLFIYLFTSTFVFAHLQIKQLKEYISEILLHSEAQASKYQEKVLDL